MNLCAKNFLIYNMILPYEFIFLDFKTIITTYRRGQPENKTAWIRKCQYELSNFPPTTRNSVWRQTMSSLLQISTFHHKPNTEFLESCLWLIICWKIQWDNCMLQRKNYFHSKNYLHAQEMNYFHTTNYLIPSTKNNFCSTNYLYIQRIIYE